jgi:hypothetical protein
MSFGTIGGMKVLAVKGIEKYSNLWEVHYTRQHGKTVQDAVFLCDTPEEAKQKYKELLDVLQHHAGVYLSKKAKKKLKADSSKPPRRMRIGDTVKVINKHYPRYGEVGKAISKEPAAPFGFVWRVRFADKKDGLYLQETLKILTAR